MATSAGDGLTKFSSPDQPDQQGDDLEDLVIFFNYRSLYESDCLDTANCESWKEVLEAFGYSKFTRIGFLRELSLATPAEVMQSLCPYTTKSEWGPVLNKRHVRLEREIKNLCQVEMLPLQGFKDFLITCAKGCRNLTTVFLSPFNETCTRTLLDQSEILSFIDLVHCYTEREFAMLEALEMLNLPPPILPVHLNNRWAKPEDATATLTEEEEQRMLPNPAVSKTRMIAFESDPTGVATALEFGVAPIGVSFNCFEANLHLGGVGLSPDASAAKAAGKPSTPPKTVHSYAVATDDEDEDEAGSEEQEDEEPHAGSDDEEPVVKVSSNMTSGDSSRSGSPSPRSSHDSARRESSQARGSHAKPEEGMIGHLQDAADGGSSVGTKGDATLLDSGVVTVVRDFTSLKYEYLPHMIPAPRVAWKKRTV